MHIHSFGEVEVEMEFPDSEIVWKCEYSFAGFIEGAIVKSISNLGGEGGVC